MKDVSYDHLKGAKSSGLLSKIGKNKNNIEKTEESNQTIEENNDSSELLEKIPSNKNKISLNKTKPKNLTKMPFEDTIANNSKSESLNPARQAQYQILKNVCSNNQIHKSHQEIASILGFKSRKSVSTFLKLLLTKGYLSILEEADYKKSTPATYRFLH